MHKILAHMRENRGLTLVELMITTVILAVVLAVINSVFFSSNDMYAKTNRRANAQMDARLGMSIMSKDLRHAGCDPTGAGITGLVRCAADTVRVRADMNGNGSIQTAEPSEDVIYAWDPATETVTRDPGTGPQLLMSNVSNFNLVYQDRQGNPLGPLPLTPAQAADVRSVILTLTTEARDAGDVTLSTRISLRNP